MLSITSVAFSPDGRYILSGDLNGTVCLWDVAKRQKLRSFGGHQPVNSVAFSPDGKYALAGGNDQSIRLYDVNSGMMIRSFKGLSETLHSVTFSPSGKYALSGGDATIRIWDIASGKEIALFADFGDGEWIVITPEGYFNASSNGAKHLNVRLNGIVYGIDQFYIKFYRPELVQLALAGRELPKGETFTDILTKKPAPSVQITSPASGSTVDKDSANISIKITDNGGGIGHVIVYLNGTQVANETRGITIKGKTETSKKCFPLQFLSCRDKMRFESLRLIKIIPWNPIQKTSF
jgi:hypothetical protein